jgi:hypothetical protein
MSGGIVDVTVTTVDGTSPIAMAAINSTYTSPVTVTGLSVHSGPPAGGTSGCDHRNGLYWSVGCQVWRRRSRQLYGQLRNTQITATSPAGGGTVDVTVTNGSYSSAPVYG